MDSHTDSEEDRDTYNADSYRPTVQPKQPQYKMSQQNLQIYLQPIPSVLFFPHQ